MGKIVGNALSAIINFTAYMLVGSIRVMTGQPWNPPKKKKKKK